MNSAGLLDLIGVKDWPLFVVVSARVAGLFLAAPLWSMTSLPRSVRSGAAVLLSVALLPSVRMTSPLPDDMLAMSAVLGGETLLGLAIGLTGALMMNAVVLAGEVTSIQMGLSLGQALGSLPEGATVGVGQLQGYFALLIYLGLNGHLTLYQGLAHSFQVVPPGQALVGTLGGRSLVDLTGSVFSAAVQAAAPILVALLLANLALAILGKAVPQLNVMMVSFPVTISLGLLTLGAGLPLLASFLGRDVAGLPETIDRTVQAFTVPTGGP
jgi:flagellar biosynthetic protein FliR